MLETLASVALGAAVVRGSMVWEVWEVWEVRGRGAAVGDGD